MKKFIYSVAALLTIGFTAQAQEIKYGIKAGLNLADWGMDAENTNVRPGLNVGVLAEINFTENFAIQPEVVYSQQGTKLTVNTFTYNQPPYTTEYTSKLDYINVPIAAKYYIIDGLSIQAGPQVGFLINAKDRVEVPESIGGDISVEQDAKDGYKKVDFSILGGIGYDLPLGIFVQARYTYGLSNINDDKETSDVKLSNNVISFSVGYKF
jgi:opacity protein-like surface antigen